MNTTAATRLLAVMLAVSLAGNAALLLRSASAKTVAAPSMAAPKTSLPASAGAPGSGAGARAISPEAAAELSRTLSASSLEDFRALLEAAGVEPKLRRQLLQVALTCRYEERFRDGMFPYGKLMRSEWWRDPSIEEYHPAGVSAKRRQEDSLALSKQFNAELAALLGEELGRLDLDDPDNGWIARRFSGLPKEKAVALHRIEQDYQELEQEIHARAGNFMLPSDEEKIRLLKQEQERDIAALLTPEERAEWELRASSTADRARNHATRYRATEEEYRRIYALQKTFDDAFDFDPFAPAGAREEQDWKARQEAEKALEASIRAIVGAERHAEALKRQSSDYSLAVAAVERLDLPADTPDRLYALRAPAAAESRKIATDSRLSPAQKKEALVRLAADTRSQIEASLGKEAATIYQERGGMGWLRALDEGIPIQFSSDSDNYEPFSTEAQNPTSVTKID